MIEQIVFLQGLIRSNKVRRSLELIVDDVRYVGNRGELDNPEWAYEVPFAFRDALDIRYQERQEHKQSVYRWTQGPYVAFSPGDLLHHRDTGGCVQVLSSVAVRVEPGSGQTGEVQAFRVDAGYVHAQFYQRREGRYFPMQRWSGTQWAFLEGLISDVWAPAEDDAPGILV